MEDYLGSEHCQRHLRPFLQYLTERHKQQGGVTEIRSGAPIDRVDFVGFLKPKDVDGLVKALCSATDRNTEHTKHPRIGEGLVSYVPHAASPRLCSQYGKGKLVAAERAADDTGLVAYGMFVARIEPVRPLGTPPTDRDRMRAGKVGSAVGRFFTDRGVRPIAIDAGSWLEVLIPTIRYDLAWAIEQDQALVALLNRDFATGEAEIVGLPPGEACPLPGSLTTLEEVDGDRPDRFVRLCSRDFPDDVDLFGLLAEEIAAFNAAEQEMETPTPAEEPAATQPARTQAAWDGATAGKVLAAVLTRSELGFRIRGRGEEQCYELQECPCGEGRRFGCCVVVRTDGTFLARCHHGATWKDYKQSLGWREHARAVMRELGVAPRSFVPYLAADSGLYFRRHKRAGRVRLTNFTAAIAADIEEDDGTDTRRTFEVVATLDGRTTRFMVPAAQFRSMNWVADRLGATAVLFPGAKAHAPLAIQMLSNPAVQKVYKHVGWTEIHGQPVYLHAGGGIGADGPVAGVRVDLPGPLALYRLPAPPSGCDLRTAVLTSLRVLDVAPDAVTAPLFAAVWRAPLGATDFAQALTGPSGAGKSELAALLQQHAGAELDSRHLPANWLSTPAANETLAFLVKDSLLVVDDFVPAGGRSDAARVHQEADRLLRAQGNSAGRGRLRADVSLQPQRPPRASIVMTGEVVPRGQSLLARLLVLKVASGEVDWERMTGCQKDAAAGLYAAAFAGFVRWLAPRLAEVRRAMPVRLAALRERATASGLHKRTPGIVASLFYGLQLFIDFAVDIKALTEAKAKALRERCWQALGVAAEAQAEFQRHGEPAQRFLELLQAAIREGKAHVAGLDGTAPAGAEGLGWRADGDAWAANGDCVGWVDAANLFLDPDAAYAAAQRMAQGGHELGVGPKALHKRLYEQGYLASTEKARGHLTLRKTLQGRVRVVLHLRAEVLGPSSLAGPTRGRNKKRPRKP